jgi:hypothetical protein
MRINFKNKKLIIVLSIAAIGVIAAAFILFAAQETSLDFKVIDMNSRSWVYDLTAHFQDRVTKGFKTVSYRFSRVKPGTWELKLDAPSYESKTISVSLFPGRNALAKPVELEGYVIPDLADFSVFEKIKDNNLILDVRLVRKDGEAVVNHPCINIIILARIQAQMVNGKPGSADSGESVERGDVLFYGKADWKWNASLTEVYRYAASISLASIKTGVSPFWIIDYLFIVPDPRLIKPNELEDLVSKTSEITTLPALEKLLAEYKGKLTWFYKSNANVEGK